MLNKVPEVTVYFWVIKILCTTVGETASDNLSDKVGLGLTNTTYITAAVLAVTLFFQFRLRRYVPIVYWFAVVLISIVGTQITDNLTDNAGVSLVTTTTVFSVALALTFAAWYWSEGTLSIHTIYKTRREAWYWLTVLFTFALGTAAGDLIAERLSLGYWKSALIFAGAIAIVFVAHIRFGLNPILAFWIAYVLTRPLGASIGDYLSQAKADGGRGLGTTATTIIFLATILAVVLYLTLTKRDRIEEEPAVPIPRPASAVPRVLVVASDLAATPLLVEAVRRRAAVGPVEFVVLVPNPDHLPFDRVRRESHDGPAVLGGVVPELEQVAGGKVAGRIAANPNAYDDIVEELSASPYTEVILETSAAHLAQWLHVDLPRRVAHLGVPVTAIVPAHA